MAARLNWNHLPKGPFDDRADGEKTLIAWDRGSASQRLEPRLSRTLFPTRSPAPRTAPVPSGADDAANLATMVNTIYARLQLGLGGYWVSMVALADASTGAAGKAWSEHDIEDLSGRRGCLEEAWAQLVIEMTFGTYYHSPGYGLNSPAGPLNRKPPDKGQGQHAQDAWFFQKVRENMTRRDSPHAVFSLLYACQQLSTAVLMSRGAGYHHLADFPFSCCENVDAMLFNNIPVGDGAVKHRFAAHPDEKGITRVTVGSVLFKKDHVGAVVRVDPKPADGKRRKYQMIDTGAWVNVLEGGRNFDTDMQHRDAYRGTVLGMLVPEQPGDGELAHAVRLLQNARPLGVGRLVIRRRPGGPVLWVSPKLNLHEKKGDRVFGYSIARLLASLWNCPFADRYEVTWQVWSPSGGEALKYAFDEALNDRLWARSAGELQPIVQLFVQRDGTPGTTKNYSSHANGFHEILKTFDIGDSEEASLRRFADGSASTLMGSLLDIDSKIPGYFRHSIPPGVRELVDWARATLRK